MKESRIFQVIFNRVLAAISFVPLPKEKNSSEESTVAKAQKTGCKDSVENPYTSLLTKATMN